jgi:hypothetical protein
MCSPELSIQWGYSLTLGGRWYMEDYHTARVQELPSGEQVGLFAIYDGHGGRQCVQFVQKRLFKTILSAPSFIQGDVLSAMHDGYMSVRPSFLSAPSNQINFVALCQ